MELSTQPSTHPTLDFGQDYTGSPAGPKDDLLYLQEELEQHLSKAESEAYAGGGEAQIGDFSSESDGNKVEEEAFSHSTASERVEASASPSVEEDEFLPPAPPIKPDPSFTEETEFQENTVLPEAPQQEARDFIEYPPEEQEGEYQEEVVETHEEVAEHSPEDNFEIHEPPQTQEDFTPEELPPSEPEISGFLEEHHFEEENHTAPEELVLPPEQEHANNHVHFQEQQVVEEAQRELQHASEEELHNSHLLENPVTYHEDTQDSELVDNARMDTVGVPDQFAVEKQESTLLQYTSDADGAGEATINEFEHEASLPPSEHVPEVGTHMADTLGVVMNEHQAPSLEPVVENLDDEVNEAKPSFNEIKRELEKKKMQNGSPRNSGIETGDEPEVKKSFSQIRMELERKNIVSSLQSQPPQTQQRAGPSDMESSQQQQQQQQHQQGANGGYLARNSGSHMNGGGDSSGYTRPRPTSGDETAMNRAGRSREGRGNAPAGIAQVRQTLSMADLQLSHVTVYTDRAELVRTITPVFKAGEIVEMLFENVSSAIDKDSIRVELRGAATILDVTYTARTSPHLEESWAQSINDLNLELRQCHRTVEALTSRLTRLEKQRVVLDNFTDGMTRKTEEEVFAVALAQQQMPAPPEKDKHDKKHDKHHKKSQLSPQEDSAMNKRSFSELNCQANPYDPTHMDTLQRFLTMYEDQAERLDSSILSSEEELDRIRDRMSQIERELCMLEKRQDDNLIREISVLIEPREDGPVDMLITYVVGRCLWKPAYDIRLFNSDGSMKIIYYGLVQQMTGEDWEPRRMTLSTAQPSSEGLCPGLGLQRLHYKQTASHFRRLQQQQQGGKNKKAHESSASRLPPPAPASMPSTPLLRAPSVGQNGHGLYPPNATYIPEEEVAIVGNYVVATLPRSRPVSVSSESIRARRSSSRIRGSILEESPRTMVTPHGTLHRAPSYEAGTSTLRAHSINRVASRQALGTSLLLNSAPPNENQGAPMAKPLTAAATVIFEVPRPPAVVPSNNEDVRVTVGLIDLQPTYDYVTVPKRSLSAFLKAHVKNSSNFYILPGQTNIYSDNTFIGKSELGAVAPGEDLSCDLGAESGIEVVYRPMFKSKENATGQKATVSFKQIIDVRNTFQRPVRVMVVDQLPSSGEDKIKVTLIEPNIKNPEKYDKKKSIRMNKHHNIEWDLNLNAGESKEVVLRYNVEYPASEELEVCVDQE